MAATLDLGALGFTLTLDKSGWNKGWNEADKDLSNNGNKLRNFASGVGNILKTGVATAAVAAGTALLSMAKAGIDNARDLEKAMGSFKASTGSTADEAEKVKAIVKDLYKVNKDSYEELGKTAEALHNNMGMNADDIGKYAQKYLNYAKVTKQSNEEAVAAIDDLGDAWDLSYDQQVSAMDKILVLSQKYGISVTDTQSALKELAPAAKAAGYSMDDAASYLAMFAASGVDAGTASAAFSKALQTVKSPDELRRLIADIQATDDPFARAQKASELFGAKAGPKMAAALAEGKINLADFITQMNGAAGAVDTAAASVDNNFDTRMELLQKKFGAVATSIGEKLLPIAESLLGWVEQHMPEIEATINTVVDAIGQGIAWFSENIMPSLETAFNAIWSVIQAVWPTIQTVITTVIGVISGILSTFSALLSGDWSSVWEGFKGVVTNVWEGIKSQISGAWESIKSTFSGAIASVGNTLSSGWESIKTATSDAWNAISKKATEIWGGVKNVVTGVWNDLDKATGGALSKMQNDISSAWTGVRNGTTSVWDAIKTTVTSVTGTIGSVVSTAFEGIKNTATDIWNGIKSAIETPINAAKDFVGGIIDKIKGFFSSLSFKLPEFEWPKIKLPHFSITGSFSLSPLSIPKLGIDWYAKGAIFAKPTIFPTAQGLKGVGDVPGGEVVAPLTTLREYIVDALRDALPTTGALTLVLEIDGQGIARAQLPYMDMLLSGEVNRRLRGVINEL